MHQTLGSRTHARKLLFYLTVGMALSLIAARHLDINLISAVGDGAERILAQRLDLTNKQGTGTRCRDRAAAGSGHAANAIIIPDRDGDDRPAEREASRHARLRVKRHVLAWLAAHQTDNAGRPRLGTRAAAGHLRLLRLARDVRIDVFEGIHPGPYRLFGLVLERLFLAPH